MILEINMYCSRCHNPLEAIRSGIAWNSSHDAFVPNVVVEPCKNCSVGVVGTTVMPDKEALRVEASLAKEGLINY